MNNVLKNFYVLKSKWLPQNPVETFMPFITNLIITEKISSVTIETISKKFEQKYGFKLELFILRPILNKLKSDEMANLTNGKWNFEIEKMPASDIELQTSTFSKNYDDLITGFVAFCDSPKEISFEIAEKVISDFIEENNIKPDMYTGASYFFDDKDTYKFFLSEYIKKLKDDKPLLFDFLVALCESMLIKSFIFNEGLSASAFSNKTIFIDSPIIFRLLGYYGTYYEQEYKFLIESLIANECKIYIFKRNYDEVLRVLRTAERFVENKDYDFVKASDVCNYFRSQRKTTDDVAYEIELLTTNLTSLGISIFKDEIDWKNYQFVEDPKEVRSAIVSEYRKNDSSHLPEDAITIDANSTIDIYLLRKNNNVQLLKDVTTFYMSSNHGFVNAIRKYNWENYPDTISPVVSDSFIGMIISSENAEKATKIATNKILSFCYGAFKPTQAMKEKFMTLITEEKYANRISENDYIALKNHPMVNDFLIRSTSNSIEEISSQTIYEVLDLIKAGHVFDIQQAHDKQMCDVLKKHNKEIEDLRLTQKTEIDEINEKHYKKNLSYAQEEFSRFKKKALLLYKLFGTFISVILLASTIAQIIFQIYLDEAHTGLIITTVVIGVASIASTVLSIKSYCNTLKIKFVNKILNKKREKLKSKYDVDSKYIL